MHDYSLAIDQVVRLVGDKNGRMEMTTLFYKLGRLPESVDGEELAYRLTKIGYLYRYGFDHEQFGTIKKGDWILTEKGWSHYRDLKERDDMDIPY